MRILVDLDGIVVDLLSKWIRLYNRDFGDCLTVAMVDSWDISECVKPTCSPTQIFEYIRRPGFFDDLPPIPGAIEAVKELVGAGHAVRFCTTPAGADSARAKMEWIDRHFQGMSLGMFLCRDKDWIDADLLIDDKPENITSFNGYTATIEYPYNAHIPTDCMASDCHNTEQAWEEILGFVKDLSNNMRQTTPIRGRR